jgi:hypothetical protein
LAIPAGFEPATHGVEIRYSIGTENDGNVRYHFACQLEHHLVKGPFQNPNEVKQYEINEKLRSMANCFRTPTVQQPLSCTVPNV